MSIKESVDTSCLMSSIGNNGARSCGPTGSPVPGCNGGGGGEGRSGITLYHCRGISDSSSTIFVRSATTPPPSMPDIKTSSAPYAPPPAPQQPCPALTRDQSPCGSWREAVRRSVIPALSLRKHGACNRIQETTPMLTMYTVAASSSTSYRIRMSPACNRQVPVAPHATTPSGYG